MEDQLLVCVRAAREAAQEPQRLWIYRLIEPKEPTLPSRREYYNCSPPIEHLQLDGTRALVLPQRTHCLECGRTRTRAAQLNACSLAAAVEGVGKGAEGPALHLLISRPECERAQCGVGLARLRLGRELGLG